MARLTQKYRVKSADGRLVVEAECCGGGLTPIGSGWNCMIYHDGNMDGSMGGFWHLSSKWRRGRWECYGYVVIAEYSWEPFSAGSLKCEVFKR